MTSAPSASERVWRYRRRGEDRYRARSCSFPVLAEETTRDGSCWVFRGWRSSNGDEGYRQWKRAMQVAVPALLPFALLSVRPAERSWSHCVGECDGKRDEIARSLSMRAIGERSSYFARSQRECHHLQVCQQYRRINCYCGAYRRDRPAIAHSQSSSKSSHCPICSKSTAPPV